MRVLQKILFTFAMVIGLSIAVSAQKNDEPKKTPPKDKPPVINPGEKKNPPKKDDKPKKQNNEAILVSKESLNGIA